jgi:hypothetical protein
MGGPDPLVFSEDSQISHHEEFHPRKHLPGRSLTHFSIRNDLEGHDGSLYANNNTDVWRDSSLRKIWGGQMGQRNSKLAAKVLTLTSRIKPKPNDPS